MKVSLNLVKEFTPIKIPIDQLVGLVGSRIAEVDNVEYVANRYKDIVVAEIVEVKGHPNADKLGVYRVNTGKDYVEVVAGDKKLQKGDKVAYIPPGAVVPSTFGTDDELKIEQRELRGVVSNGMLASAQELYFGHDASRVLVLDTDYPAGTSIIDAYNLDDVILDIENKTLTNRPDMFGHIGFAREIAAIQGIKFTSPDWIREAEVKFKLGGKALPLAIENKIPELCARYTAVVIDDVTVKQSPLVQQALLNRLGIRPMNNIVDLTNYLMLVSAQPTHAFDYDKISGQKIIIRHPTQGENLELLNGKTIKLTKDDIVIADADKPLALGGVMGGLESEITEQTTKVVLESANFDMYAIRKTSMKHGVFSEAATRFSRGQDPNQCLPVLLRAASLLEQDQMRVASPVLDDYVKPRKPWTLSARVSKINQLIGFSLDAKTMQKLLELVEMSVEVVDDRLNVTVPTWRPDLQIEEDIAEEVARLYGYENIAPKLPIIKIRPASVAPLLEYEEKIARGLAAAGMTQVLTYSFISEKLAKLCNQDTSLNYRVRNAISPEAELMRSSLVPSLASKVHSNIKRKYEQVNLFELGKIRTKHDMEENENLPYERRVLGGVFAVANKYADQRFTGSAYFLARKYAEYLFDQLGVSDWSFLPITDPSDLPIWVQQIIGGYDLNRTALISIGNQIAGVAGEFAQSVKEGLKLPNFSSGLEVDIQTLQNATLSKQINKVPKFPFLELDVCYRVGIQTNYSELRSVITKALKDSGLLWQLSVVDIYSPKDAGYKQITHRIRVWHPERTLTTDEGNALIKQISKQVSEKLNGELI